MKIISINFSTSNRNRVTRNKSSSYYYLWN